MNINSELRNLVFTWPTKYKEGFIPDELRAIKEKFPQLNEEKFNMALTGITCIMHDGEFCIYFIDVLTALRCGLENRDIKPFEFD